MLSSLSFTLTSLIAISILVTGARANASQKVVADSAGDASAVDAAEVAHYKSLLDIFSDTTAFTQAYKWTNLLDAYTSPASCSPRCLAGAPGCNPDCAQLGRVSSTSTTNFDNGSFCSFTSSTSSRRPRHPWAILPPLACPCHCEDWCPTGVAAICCFTPGGNRKTNPSAASAVPASAATKDDSADTQIPNANGEDGQKGLLDSITGTFTTTDSKTSTKGKIPPFLQHWKPSSPLGCPCFCAAGCPAYIQAICCVTPGVNITAGDVRKASQDGVDYKIAAADSKYETTRLVVGDGSGEPVEVLAVVNATSVVDSFVTMGLVRGLGREKEVVYHEEGKIFEITLDVVLRRGKEDITLAQTFVVFDGSLLLEQEQVLLGLGFVSRIGAVAVQKDVLGNAGLGLNIVTGMKE